MGESGTTINGQVCQRGHDAATEAIRTQADTLLATAPLVCDLDPDAIHDMRVASRRLRMALTLYRPCLPKKPRKALQKQARRITSLLGSRRELDVMVAMLREHRNETRSLWLRFMDHAIEVLEVRRAAQIEFCREAAILAESDAFHDTVAQILDGVDASGLCLLPLARAELKCARQEARFARRAWKQSGDPEDLHQVRIALKHLRYACEFHAPLFGDPMQEYLREVKQAQALLGEWNECRLLEEMVLTLGNAAEYHLAQGAPLVAEAYGNRAADLAGEFKRAGKALLGGDSRKAFRKLLRQPVVTCCATNVGATES